MTSPRSSTGAARAPAAAVLARHAGSDGIDWEIVDAIASTNTEWLERARRAAPRRPAVLCARLQTGGRGRRGRAWLGTPGGALLFSLALPWRRTPAQSAAVTLACGTAVATCLAAAVGPIALKWPNDVLLEDRKLAGLLVELAEDAGGARTLVVGLGLNLQIGAAERRAIEQPVADLAERLGRVADEAEQEDWLVRLALALLEAARRFEAEGFAPFRAAFERRCAWLGREVVLHEAAGARRRGILRGVDAQGGLRLECEGEIVTIISGEMSLRTHASPMPPAAPAIPGGAP
jgi:BirA family biotin operon repressor/biotin-[acetyl-CoA-carboxylase] ligase